MSASGGNNFVDRMRTATGHFAAIERVISAAHQSWTIHSADNVIAPSR
jgi:hypothetical protein